MDFSPVIYAIPLFFILIIIELVYEFKTQKKTYRVNDAITNINLGSLDQVCGIFSKILKIGIYTFIFEKLSFFQLEATWGSFIVLFVLYDLCYYWSHRMAHTISLFWGGHIVHHQSEDFNLSVALRQSSTQFLWSLPFYLPLALLGFSPVQFAFVIGWNLIYQFWIHTEHIDKMPHWFEWVMNTPSHHRVHHGRDPKYIDKNYAGVFIIWDRLFKTFVKEEERPNYGITKPLNSWNPVYANVVHYIDLFKTARKSRSFLDTLKILFYKPGWQPEYLGGYIAPFQIETGYKKYDAGQKDTPFLLYVLVQFLVALGLISFFLFFHEKFSSTILAVYVLWFLITIITFSLYFESGNIYVLLTELVRLFMIPISALLFFGLGKENGMIILIFLSAYALISAVWYYRIQRSL